MADLVSEGGEFSCQFCTGSHKLNVLQSSSSGASKKIANKTNCFLPPPGGNCSFPPGVPPSPCPGIPPGGVLSSGQSTVKIDGVAALGEGCKFMCPKGQSVALSKAGQTVGKHDEASVAAEVASLITDFIPIVGSGKSVLEFVLGKDPITGAEMSRSSAAAGIAFGMVPGGKALYKGKKGAAFVRALHRKITSRMAARKRPKAISQDTKSRKISNMSQTKKQSYREKLKNRKLTKDEYKTAYREKRFENRRREGIKKFWKEEKERIQTGQKPSREWTPQQRQDILNNKIPKEPNGKAIEGHHKYSAREYPQHANDPKNIEPLTRAEHLQRHGGNTKNPTHGHAQLH